MGSFFCKPCGTYHANVKLCRRRDLYMNELKQEMKKLSPKKYNFHYPKSRLEELLEKGRVYK